MHERRGSVVLLLRSVLNYVRTTESQCPLFPFHFPEPLKLCPPDMSIYGQRCCEYSVDSFLKFPPSLVMGDEIRNMQRNF